MYCKHIVFYFLLQMLHLCCPLLWFYTAISSIKSTFSSEKKTALDVIWFLSSLPSISISFVNELFKRPKSIFDRGIWPLKEYIFDIFDIVTCCPMAKHPPLTLLYNRTYFLEINSMGVYVTESAFSTIFTPSFVDSSRVRIC